VTAFSWHLRYGPPVWGFCAPQNELDGKGRGDMSFPAFLSSLALLSVRRAERKTATTLKRELVPNGLQQNLLPALQF